jgi:dTDP-4-amino-4,6-dideoxygalactose transaminase
MLPRPAVRELAARLAAAGVESRRLYVPPVHRHPAYVGYQCAEEMIHSECLSTHSLSVPCHGAMTEAEVDDIASIVNDAAG